MRTRTACLIAALCLAAAPVLAQRPTNTYVIEAGGSLPADLAQRVAGAGGTLLRSHAGSGLAIARSDNAGFAGQLEGNGLKVTQDYEIQFVPAGPDPQIAPLALGGEVSGANHLTALPPQGAFFFGCQWNMRQIDAPAAWNAGLLGDGVKIGYLDSGIDPFHIDLQDKVDLTLSASALVSSPCGAFDVDTIFDLNFHGTFGAGIIASNNIGTAGVAPNAEIVAVKVLNCGGGGTFGELFTGITYAADAGVDIINLSLGALFPRDLPGAGRLIGAINKAVNYANGKGIPVFAAAGNEGVGLDHAVNFISVPAESGAAISVYATDQDDALASYSNFGKSATWIGGPGGGDVPNTSAPLPGCPVNNVFESLVIAPCSSFVCGANNLYVLANGTSFATPAVAGVAALVEGKHGGALNAGQMKTLLQQTADDLGATGVDELYSHGRVNAGNAVE